MSNYRRNFSFGGTFFFTVNLNDRREDLLVTQIDSLRLAVKDTMHRYPFHVDGWVVLPNHMHCLWTLPPNDKDYPSRLRSIKILFSRAIPKTESRSFSRINKGERGIWQRRYWEHTIRNEQDHVAHMNYIYINPLKHGLVEAVKEWPHSSFHRDVKRGLYPLDWACGIPDFNLGEPEE